MISATTKVILVSEKVTTATLKIISATTKVILATEEVRTATLKVISASTKVLLVTNNTLSTPKKWYRPLQKWLYSSIKHHLADHNHFKSYFSHYKSYLGYWRSYHSHFKGYFSHYKVYKVILLGWQSDPIPSGTIASQIHTQYSHNPVWSWFVTSTPCIAHLAYHVLRHLRNFRFLIIATISKIKNTGISSLYLA